jgi:hypothetical protein
MVVQSLCHDPILSLFGIRRDQDLALQNILASFVRRAKAPLRRLE